MKLFILFIISLVGLISAEEITLTRYSGAKTEDQLVYTLPITIDSQVYKLRFNLDEEKSWVKSNKCKSCVNLECKESCSGKLGPAKEGLKCQQSFCTTSNNDYNENNIEGSEVQIAVNAGKEFNKNISVVLVDKVKFKTDNYTRQYDGIINLFEEPELFESFVLYEKDKKMYLGIDEELDEKYQDPKDQPFNETFESDGGIEVKGIHIGDQDISTDNKGHLQLNTKSLHLPEEEFDALKQKVEKINPSCSLQSGLLKCSGSSDINKIKDLLVGISFGEHKLEVPFSIFIDSCKSKECQIFIKQSEEDKVILGEIIFAAFAVHIHTSDRVVTFHRLKNSFSNKYHELAGIKSNSIEQSRSFFGYIGSFFVFFFKIIIVLALISLCINLYYNKARVTRWIVSKTQRQDGHYSPAFTEDIENAGVLQGYDPKNASRQFWQENTVDGI